MRLLKLTIKNFRGFGPSVDTIDLDADLVLFYGPNGHGKTSLSEAVEWLFYGTTKRRERGDGYSKSEYTGSFANAHGGGPTEVSLLLRLGGKAITLIRRLGDKETSVTYVDGKEADFSTVGILPLEVYYPVVAQHGLQTFIHARPKDRRDAICAALGLDELTSLKAALERARLSFQKTPPTAVTNARNKLRGFAAELSQIGPTKSVAARWSGNPATVDVAIDEQALLAAAAHLTAKPASDAQTALKLLRDERAKAGQEVFDVSLLAPPELFEERKVVAMEKRDELVSSLRKLDDLLGKFAGAAAARYSAALLSFWQQGLALPESGDDCPMCEAPTLSKEPRSKLHERLANEKSTVEAIAAIDEAARAATGSVGAFVAAITGLGIKGTDESGKTRLLAMLGDQGTLPQYVRHHDALLEARTRLGNALRRGREIGSTTKDRAANPEQLPQLISDRQLARDELIAVADAMTESLSNYEGAWAQISGELNAKIAANKSVAAIDAVGQAIQSMQDVRLLTRYAEILDETQLLIRSIKTTVQRKQQALLKSRGKEVKEYYELLNPGVKVGFDEMEPATDAMKLHATSFGKRMSAAANLSECQLNCLGLTMWLMRATTSSSPFGFVLLDDPVQAMDDDHAEAFKAEQQTEAKKRAVAFPETIEAVREMFRTYAPDQVLSVTSGFALQTTATDTAVSEKSVGGPNLGQHHIELLQALALTMPAEEWGIDLGRPPGITRAFDLTETLNDSFHIRRYADIDKITNQGEMRIRSIQERLRLHTQIVRNWGYLDHVVAISKDLYGPFDPAIKAKFGLTATEIITLFVTMIRTIEVRSTKRLACFASASRRR